ncbi:flagellar biosynthetic protein FliR, partial [Pseudomonas syringae pv. tagetis]|uniref:flagellar biosynthetic protein FliR n=1 Tax=Pseudomonas syringae group genomosp. 7 TaxID=251699 RepID=UPI00376FF1FA
AFCFMTRAAPQLNNLSIGLPLTLVVGMVILWMNMGDILNQYQPISTQALQSLGDMVRAR